MSKLARLASHDFGIIGRRGLLGISTRGQVVNSARCRSGTGRIGFRAVPARTCALPSHGGNSFGIECVECAEFFTCLATKSMGMGAGKRLHRQGWMGGKWPNWVLWAVTGEVWVNLAIQGGG